MLPGMTLDNDTFENLIEEYRNKIAGIYPEWTDYNYHDPGITFLELFAWLRENQQYFMEQLGDEHYRAFFRLAGFRPLGRTPARILAEAHREDRRSGGELSIPAGTLFESGGVSFETEEDERIPDADIVRVVQLKPTGERGFVLGLNQLRYQGEYRFYPFGTWPEPGAAFLLKISGKLKEKEVYRAAFSFRDSGRNPGAGGMAFAELKWEYRTAGGFRELTVLSDETGGMLYSGRVAFRMDCGKPAAEKETELRVTFVSGEYDVSPVLTGVSLSQFGLVQKRTRVWPEGFELGYGTGFPDQVFSLPAEQFLAGSVKIEAEDVLHPGRMLTWSGTDDLYARSPEERCYFPDELSGTVRFGNGWHGLPPEGRILLKEFAESRGAAGNVNERAPLLCRVPALSGGVFTVVRILSPGRDPESRDETLLRILREKDRIRRAVTLKDYEQLTMETPGLCLHSCRAWTEEKDPGTVHIVVRPGDGQRTSALTERQKEAVSSWLEDRRLIGTKLRLHSPRYIYVDTELEVIPSPQYRNSAAILEQEILKWFREKEKIYGEPLLYSELFGRLDALPCVRILRVLAINPRSAGIRRNRNRDLIPPVNGVFLPGKTEVILNHYQVSER